MRPPLLLAALCATLLAAGGAAGAVIEPELSRQIALHAPTDEVAVIVSFPQLDYRAFEANALTRRDTRLHEALKTRAATTQAPLLDWLKENPARRVRELWIINGVALIVPVAAVGTLAQLPGVESVRTDALLEAPETTTGTAAAAEWNLSAVRAPELWSLGVTGSGVVVANMDTGVDASHPDLALSWRGGSNSWYDPHGEHAQPSDPNGHGTQTMGLMVGGNVGGAAIGIAPDARWVATKLYNDAGEALYSDIHLAFQWLLDPDGDVTTDDAPHVVNASWGLVGAAGQCISEFNSDIAILKTAGIAVAFAGGNDGPSPLTSISPANNVAGFATGAIDESRVIANFSSRGPSACDARIYPDLSAPGINIKTTDLSFGGLPLYRVVSGTSFAAPHASGALALLAGAFPQASVADLEAALLATAADLGVAGEDNSYGYGLVDAFGAWEHLAAAHANTPPVAADDAFRMIQGGTLNVPPPGILANDTDEDAGDLLSAVNFGALAPSGGTLVTRSDGSFSFTPPLRFTGTAGFTYEAQDAQGARSAVATVAIVVSANHAPVAVSDKATAPRRTWGTDYPPVRISVLANDYDPDVDIDPTNQIDPLSVKIVKRPNKGGTVAVAADGSVAYTPRAGFVGIETFGYRVRDTYFRPSISNTAYVRVSVQ
jgi:bacillopeptidase F